MQFFAPIHFVWMQINDIGIGVSLINTMGILQEMVRDYGHAKLLLDICY